MPSKKLTSQKRADLKRHEEKGQSGGGLKILLIIVVIAIVVAAAILLIPTATDGTTQTNDEPITPTNLPPVANVDYSVISLNAGETIIDVLANDIDADEDTINITDVSTPSNGTIKIENNKIHFTPGTDFNDAIEVTYTVEDGNENTATSKLKLIVGYSNPIAVFDTSFGGFAVELYEDKVPNTCDNFIKLVNDDHYDGLVFHRVIDDFMIQGGAFETDGTQKTSPYGTIDLEINAEVRHVDGAIAMARTSDPNSATNQFYICDGAQSFLDDNYAAFGVTIEGMSIVRAIAALDPEHTTTRNGMQNWPVDDVIINSITIENQ